MLGWVDTNWLFRETDFPLLLAHIFTVTFVDGLTDDVIHTASVHRGDDVEMPAAPEHEGYTFTGWDHDGKNITQDTTISALYVENFLMGDVNSDGKVNTGDAVMLLKHVAGTAKLNEQQLAVADFNGDNKVNTGDATAILLYIVKQHKKGAGSTFCPIAIKERFA